MHRHRHRPSSLLAAGTRYTLLATLTLLGCGPAVQLVHGTDRAAGTDAHITVEEVEGGNLMVFVDLQHLPPPQRVGAGLTSYVVWFAPPSQPSTLASRVEYDVEGRRGRARATSPYDTFEVVVTAERRATPREPSEFVVLRHRLRSGRSRE